MALNVHYCGGHVASISSAFSPENCGMENPKPVDDHLNFSSKHCCDDDLIVQQNENDQKQPDQDQQLYIGTTVKTNSKPSCHWTQGAKFFAHCLSPSPKAKYYQLEFITFMAKTNTTTTPLCIHLYTINNEIIFLYIEVVLQLHCLHKTRLTDSSRPRKQ